MAAGSARMDTRMMRAFGERVCCKVGAEGMYCAALPEQGLGLALKMDDGNTARACEVALAALVRAWVPARDAGQRELLESLTNVTLSNWNGIEVGRLAAAEGLPKRASA
jgi:L-asparaginase II